MSVVLRFFKPQIGIYAIDLTGEHSIIDFAAVVHPNTSQEKLEFELAKVGFYVSLNILTQIYQGNFCYRYNTFPFK